MSSSPGYVKLSQGSELVFDEVEYFIKSSDREDALCCRGDTAEDQHVLTIQQQLPQFEEPGERSAARNINA